MAKTNYLTIDQYHAAFSGESLKRMQRIRDIINKTVPEAEECISYQIPCFKYKGYLIYYAAFANHITLSNPFSQAFLDTFKEDLKNYKVSKAAIQFPNDQPLPEKMIKRMILFRKKENELKGAK
ncbi:MAG: iron chaperone [Sediminibacterium sp.]